MTANPLLALEALGQSVWLDYIRRHLITSGELARLIEQDGLGGVTSNPSIFEKAIAGSTDYTEVLAATGRRAPCATTDLYESLAIADIQDAADLLRGVYERAGRCDGYVSLEVSPLLAHDTAGTIAEARRLWAALGRENVMIKVPGTAEGTPAIRTLIGEGLNVNVTLLFSQDAYDAVAEAYLAGLEMYAGVGGDLSSVASVASFFVSRIDTAVDDPYDLGQEFFRWEIATAVAGSILGINPFDQPDVEASKIATRKLTDDFESRGSLPAETPFLAGDGLTFFADAKNAAALTSAKLEGTARACLKAHLTRLAAGDYFGLLAYVARNARHDAPLQAIRHAVRDRTRAATCVGYGPRFLHSTGQAYKGGPNSGVFLQITCDDAADLPVPGQKYTFGLVNEALA